MCVLVCVCVCEVGYPEGGTTHSSTVMMQP